MARPKGSKNIQITETKQTEILDAVKDLSLDKVSSKIAATQVEVQNQLASLSSKMTEQLAILGKVDQAIQLKREELKQLFGIEATATTLDELVADLEARRTAWEDEQTKLTTIATESEQNRRRQWEREEEQYRYQVAQDRKKLQDTFQTGLDKQAKEQADKTELLTKGWNQREVELRTRETELVDLRTQVSNFPKILDAEIAKVTNAVAKNVKSQYETDIRIKDAETASTERLRAQQIASLETVIKDLQIQLANAKNELAKAHNDVKEISQKALEAASSRETVANLQKALENSQGSKGSK